MLTSLQVLRCARDELTERLIHIQEQYVKERTEMLTELARLTEMIAENKKQPQPPQSINTYTSMHTTFKGIDHE